MSNTQSVTQLVVVGSSAGGIEALSVLVTTLPRDFPAPLVVAQHLDPSRPSYLGQILQRRSALPVVIVTNHEALKAGTIYVVPSDHHVEINDHSITLLLDGTEGIKPSIDLLLTSAAEVYGDQLIAVILTGLGSDGTSGARAVKRAGGTVIIQDPTTAAYPDMPLSLEPQTVDIVASLERIGSVLYELLTGNAVPPQADELADVQSLLQEVRETSGIDFRSYKPATIQRRLQRRILATESVNLAAYRVYLRDNPDEYQRLISSFLIKVTEFMRDSDLFSVLRDRILPELIEQAREHNNQLRMWSAGCATGEEAYSLAILLCELLGAESDRYIVKIFATDLDPDAIAFARRGLYPGTALDGLPKSLVDRYFVPQDGGYMIRKRVREMIVFGEHDLGQRAPFPQIDLILCRNVLIYFTKELQQRTLQLFAFSLRDGGFLVLGKAETVSPMDAFFTSYHVHKIYRRHGDRVVIPPPRPTKDSLGGILSNSRLRRKSTILERYRNRRDVSHVRGITEQLVYRLPVGIVVIDEHYDIQEINSAARQMLSIHTPAINEDFIHLIEAIGPRELRAAIDRTLQEREETHVLDVPIERASTGDLVYLQFDCYPQAIATDRESDVYTLILVTDVTVGVQERQRLAAETTHYAAQVVVLSRAVADFETRTADLERRNEQLQNSLQTSQEKVRLLEQAKQQTESEAAIVQQRIDRLVRANNELVAANDKLSKASEDLRTTNEEFLLSSEEAQAAMEEIETLNEEMQATNEELETMNEQLQSTVEELNTSNADQVALNAELQSTLKELQVANARLTHQSSGDGSSSSDGE